MMLVESKEILLKRWIECCGIESRGLKDGDG